MGRTVSLKKIEANRSNALRSTGPKSPEGKGKVRWNALKHGLLSSEVVIPVGEGKERRGKLARLLAHLREDLRPQGTLEEMLVEKIAVGYWRLRRLLRCETGEIRVGLEGVSSSERHWQATQAAIAAKNLKVEPAAARARLTQSSTGLAYLIGVVEQVRKEVEQLGYLSKEACRRLVDHFGKGDEELAARCLRLSPPQKDADGPDLPGEPQGATANALVDALEQEQIKLQRQRADRQWNERLEQESHVAALSVPSKDAAQTILRYEATIQRELHRTIQQLTRLQRLRKGKKGGNKRFLKFTKQSHTVG